MRSLLRDLQAVELRLAEVLEAASDSNFDETPEAVRRHPSREAPDLNRVLERVIKARSEQLGLPRFSCHDFRHAYTTWGRQAGVHAEIMGDQAGHASVLMTQDIYSHLNDRDEAAEKIGDFVRSEGENQAA